MDIEGYQEKNCSIAKTPKNTVEYRNYNPLL